MKSLLFVTSSFILNLTWAKQPVKDVYSSSGELVNVFRMEQEMVDALAKHKAEIEEQLESIKEYKEQVEQVYKNEECWPPETCTDDQLLDLIVGNPIYCYQILKRLNFNWKKLESKLAKLDAAPTVKDLTRIKRKFGGLPSEKDLQGAARALNRLKSIYRFDTGDFIKGNILGMQTAAELDVKDTFYLGRFSHLNNDPEAALNWLEQAAMQAAAASAGNGTSPAAKGGVKLSQVEQMIKAVERKLPQGFREVLQAAAAAEEPSEEEDELNPSVVRMETKYRLRVVPPKSEDISQQVTQLDQTNLHALCRGIDILPPEDRKQLMCFYAHQGLGGNRFINEIFGADLYFVIRPLKIEVAHPEPHPIIQVHDVISLDESEAIVTQAFPRIHRALVGVDKTLSEMRVSKNTWLEDDTSHVVNKVSERINWITGLQTFKKLDRVKEGKKEEYEFLQIANYGIGGHYGCHQDPMYVYKEPNEPPSYNLEKSEGHYMTGDRMSTFMLYLSEVPKGGYTAFPRLGVAVPPIKGSAVFWHNLKRSGRSDMTMLHSGCPVLLGSKWVANKWVREFANMFHRKCTGHINV